MYYKMWKTIIDEENFFILLRGILLVNDTAFFILVYIYIDEYYFY